jgi:methionine-rich copper-binding protein CopC
LEALLRGAFVKRIVQSGTALLIGMLLSLGLSPSASAHTTLVSSTPSNGEELSKIPASIEMEFGETLISLSKGTKVSVISPSGADLASSDATVTKAHLSQKLLSSNADGKYQVKYRVVAADGHVVDGQFQFTVGVSAPIMKPTSPSGGEDDARNEEGSLEGEDGGNLLIRGVEFIALASLVSVIALQLRRYKKNGGEEK